MDDSALARAIQEESRTIDFPGGRSPVLALDAVRSLSERFEASQREVEIMALSMEMAPERYLRNLNSISMASQKRLLESRVALVGLGGLGGHLLEILVRTGIGRIRAFDGDTFEAANLNRQTLSQEARLGFFKADAAFERAKAVNSSIEIEARAEFANVGALTSALEGCRLLLDALGALSDREMLAKAAARSGTPLITAAVAGWTGWVSTVFPGEESPAEMMRSIGTGGDAQNALGVPAPAVAAVAAIQAAEAVRLLTGETPALHGKMLIMDLASMSFDLMAL